jgi:hypothetical protein
VVEFIGVHPSYLSWTDRLKKNRAKISCRPRRSCLCRRLRSPSSRLTPPPRSSSLSAAGRATRFLAAGRAARLPAADRAARASSQPGRISRLPPLVALPVPPRRLAQLTPPSHRRPRSSGQRPIGSIQQGNQERDSRKRLARENRKWLSISFTFHRMASTTF